MNILMPQDSEKYLYKHALLSPTQMYQADKLTISAGFAGINLMKNAGAAIANAIIEKLPQQNVLVICGVGNNGGDGFVLAALLKQAGWPVQLALYGKPENIHGDAAIAARAWQFDILALDDLQIPDKGIIVDAILGAGLNRPIADDLAKLINQINQSNAFVCAIDVPTGLNGANGVCSPTTIQADLTVCFFRAKPGHYLLPGRSFCGELICANIGINTGVLKDIKPKVYKNHPALWLDKIRWPQLSDHKYQRGHVLTVSGAKLLGAARLSSLAAARIGAGLVTMAVPESVWAVQAAHMTSIMVEPYGNNLNDLLKDSRKNVIVIGPGLGLEPKHKDMVLQILQTKRKCVLDADALSLFADNADVLFSALHENCVLTPHAGEFSRLFKINGDKLAQLNYALSKTKAVVLLKGADTVIGAPSGELVINHNAPAYLATAGSGDVLSGAIAGLMANGLSPFMAACAGAWLHGQAANKLGFGLLAEDLPRVIPKVLYELKK